MTAALGNVFRHSARGGVTARTNRKMSWVIGGGWGPVLALARGSRRTLGDHRRGQSLQSDAEGSDAFPIHISLSPLPVRLTQEIMALKEQPRRIAPYEPSVLQPDARRTRRPAALNLNLRHAVESPPTPLGG